MTFKEWDACVAAGGCTVRPSDGGWGRGDRPVINIHWEHTQQFIRWLGRKTGQKYALPSEAQWEYAAGAGAASLYPWGDEMAGGKANCARCGNDDGGRRTAPVGSFAANRFGLHDTSGNVWEWVEDCFKDSYRGAPGDGRARSAAICEMNVIRGGSWRRSATSARITARGRAPYQMASNEFGFRVARVIRPCIPSR